MTWLLKVVCKENYLSCEFLFYIYACVWRGDGQAVFGEGGGTGAKGNGLRKQGRDTLGMLWTGLRP